ncbi:AAA family ATPase [Microlunatus sp. GCM10028923]|uniref:AAA family ATPase n=1 Tax=Microlunatus sp. GCM10028923 TaxID=3273400 RepID=UPI00360F5B0A
MDDISMQSRLLGEPHDVRRALQLLGELLTDTASITESPESFVWRALGAQPTSLACESITTTAWAGISLSAAFNDLILKHDPRLGPSVSDEAPTWTQFDIDGETLSLPSATAAHFPAGTVSSAPLVVQIEREDYGSYSWFLRVFADPAHRAEARALLDELNRTAVEDKNFYRGRMVGVDHAMGLQWKILDPPLLRRQDLIIKPDVWTELDLNLAALTDRAAVMREHGFPTRRGVLIAGPPGVGKSAVARVIAGELVGRFTVIVVDARAGANALRDVYRETERFGPALIILEDIDLYLGDRRQGDRGSALADFLSVMDGAEEYEEVITIASTNDPGALDAAAIRSARFDSIITLGYPDQADRARILTRYLAGLDPLVDVDAIAALLPDNVSGADLREIVRRALLAYGEELTTDRLRTVVKDGRWQPEPLQGSYL